MIWMILSAFAQDTQYWFQLQQARLLLMEEQTEASIDILNEIIATNVSDDNLIAEALYWKGRALYLQGYVDHSNEKLIEASNNYNLRSTSLYFLQQSAAYENRIENIPYSGNPWVNMDGKQSTEQSLMWVCSFDVNAASFKRLNMSLNGSEFPLYLTVELVDWRNERWVWRDVVVDSSQPLSLRLEQFRSPRDERKYLYRNIIVTAESEDGRRIPFSVTNLEVY